jgi:hypothetical protein
LFPWTIYLFLCNRARTAALNYYPHRCIKSLLLACLKFLHWVRCSETVFVSYLMMCTQYGVFTMSQEWGAWTEKLPKLKLITRSHRYQDNIYSSCIGIFCCTYILPEMWSISNACKKICKFLEWFHVFKFISNGFLIIDLFVVSWKSSMHDQGMQSYRRIISWWIIFLKDHI